MKYKRLKPRKRRFKDNKILLLFLLLMSIGIGYAALTTTLSINGTTNVATNSWNIHFANLQVKDGSVTGNPDATLSGNSMSITYGGELAQPGDYYEFTVDVVNEGSLPGKVSIVGLTGNNTEYLSTSYTYSNGKSIEIGDILNAGASKRLTIKAWIPEDIDTSLLPTEDTPITLTFNLQYVQSEEDAFDTNALVQKLKTENSSCFTKYTGQVTDQPGQTVTASNVYFNKCANKRNIIFNNMCWQMIRTTETGGIKMIYNGEVVDGKCESSRGNHKSIVGAEGASQSLNASYLYGDSFTYDTTNNIFTLTDTTTSTWSDSTYEGLLGKFTCKNTTGTCTTLYNVNSYSSNTTAYTSSYTLGDTNYAQIGTSPFNANYKSPAMVGYMFNKVYDYKSKSPGTTEYKYGSGFTYDTNTNTYTLSGTTQNINTWSSGYNTINNTHYTCFNTSGSCNIISYIYHTSSSYAYYFDITGGKDITDAINEMLYDNNINRYNSSIKGIIDAWYRENLSSKTNMLEDTVYCNARNITNDGEWDPEGVSITSDYYIKFKSYTSNNDISCANETDQFAVSNNKAKLTYPVSLINNEEWYNIGTGSLRKTGTYYWGLSPDFFSVANSNVRYVGAAVGSLDSNFVNRDYGLRPAVSLVSGIVISSGTGSTTDPFVIQE